MSDNNNLNLFFPTPIWSTIVDNYSDLNKSILDYIKEIQTKDPIGIKRSNSLGWHSKDFSLDDKIPINFINSIHNAINQALDDMGWDKEKNKIKITSMWTIINKQNASNARHIHANNFLSAAYYVKAPDECGDIIFYDPRDAKSIRKPKISSQNNLNADIVNITPKEGSLILFPSYIHHSVSTNKSNKERIVISFNIDLL